MAIQFQIQPRTRRLIMFHVRTSTALLDIATIVLLIVILAQFRVWFPFASGGLIFAFCLDVSEAIAHVGEDIRHRLSPMWRQCLEIMALLFIVPGCSAVVLADRNPRWFDSEGRFRADPWRLYALGCLVLVAAMHIIFVIINCVEGFRNARAMKAPAGPQKR